MTPTWPAGDALVRAAPGDWSVSVRDAGGSALWSHRADVPRKAASTIKLAVLVALFRAVDAGRLDLRDTRELIAADKVGGSGVLRALHEGLRPTLGDLAYLMIAISDNTASNLLIDAVGFAAVDATIRDLGLRATVLGRKFYGRPADPGERENVTTAGDLTALLGAILAGQQHRDRLARFLPADVSYAGKGGSLPGTALDAGILFAPVGPLTIAAIAADLPHPFAADETMGRLAVAALANAEWGMGSAG